MRNKSADCGFEGGKKIRKSNGTGWLLSANLSGPLVALAHGPGWAPSMATGGSLSLGVEMEPQALLSVPARPEAPVHCPEGTQSGTWSADCNVELVSSRGWNSLTYRGPFSSTESMHVTCDPILH